MNRVLKVSTVVGLCGALAALVAPVMASELKLSDALRSAGLKHPSAQAKLAELQAANKDVDAAKWGRFPTVTVQGTTSNSQPETALLIQQPLWEGGRITGQILLAQASVRQAEASLLETRQSNLQQTSTTFFEILRLKERLILAQKSEAEHQKLVELIDRRVKSEISPVADAILAKARKQQSTSERIQVERALQAAQLTLDQWVGPQAGEPKLPTNLPWQVKPVDQFVASAKAFSGELRRLQAAQEVAQAQIQIASAASWPGLYLVNRQALGGAGYALTGARNQTYLSLNFSPGAGLSAAAAAEAAKARAETASQSMALYERQLEQQVRNGLSEAQSLQLQRATSQELIKATEEVVDSYLRQYQIGRKNWLDVLNALRESIQAANSAGEIEYGLYAVKLRLLLSSGQLNLDNLESIHD
jgi:adhesin transport system outer membrane protein